jgi:hypothetical protein
VSSKLLQSPDYTVHKVCRHNMKNNIHTRISACRRKNTQSIRNEKYVSKIDCSNFVLTYVLKRALGSGRYGMRGTLSLEYSFLFRKLKRTIIKTLSDLSFSHRSPRSLLECFGGIYRFQLQCRSQLRNQSDGKQSRQIWFLSDVHHNCPLLGFPLHPED